MRKSLLLSAAAILTIAAVVPFAIANKSSVPNGTAIKLEVGKTAKIVVSGTQGCKFDVMTTSSNTNAATVTPTSTQKPSHTVEITGVAPGTSTVTLMTANGSIPQCQGFTFSYPVTVTPDITGTVNQGKTKIANAGKEIAALNKDLTKEYCDALKQILVDLNAGVITTSLAVDGALGLTQDAISGLATQTEEILDTLDDSLASRAIAAGFDETNYPATLVLGGCGLYDAMAVKVFSDFDKAVENFRKKIKKFIADASKIDIKKGGGGLVINVPPAIVTLGEGLVIAVDTLPAPPKPHKNLKITWAASGRLSTDANSKLTTGGIADPADGNVTVKVTGPGGTTSTQVVAVDNKCRYKASFAGLPPGDYVIESTQGANGPVTRTHKVL